jgi:hypothetical protein
MRRNKAPKRGRQPRSRVGRIRIGHVLVAATIGYLLNGWHNTELRSVEPSAAETVAMRFPEISGNTATALSAPIVLAAARRSTGGAELALLNPEPMVPQVRAPIPAAAAPQVDRPIPVETATIDAAASSPVPDATPPVQAEPPPAPAKAVTTLPPSATKPVVAAVHHPVVNQPGYMLNDAQIASIKQRLNLTPGQEQMWPSVEVALRNMAYAHGQPVHGRAVPLAQDAVIDPNAVQGLKSAAAPLIMSFNTEQKEEVRNLVHVMGLDQLAAQF